MNYNPKTMNCKSCHIINIRNEIIDIIKKESKVEITVEIYSFSDIKFLFTLHNYKWILKHQIKILKEFKVIVEFNLISF